MTRYVAYYRVSTRRQGESGLGLEAQMSAVRAHVGHAPLVAEFTEVESGKVNARPQLEAAIRTASLYGATLVIAKLDRLSRNAAFLLSLRDSGVDFVCADMPNANRLTVGILAVVAEAEREAISARTKAALDAAKARGTRLGGDRGNLATVRALGNVNSAKARSAAAAAHALRLAPLLADLEADGVRSASGIARALNEKGLKTPRGRQWTAVQVKAVRDRLAVR
ncbi:recombinase family protein [Nitrospirillum viridazoti]|uniref:Resolvase n=1 Tax=Nitrospirillum viridazoti CBAmc TaxID=1441467 RepID=A0A248JN58_9PROT|nr:recombinase family protein [Nitrospirillum amazonense]ASG19508.1 resolvase [Nitrospirillum amazonense CBAmc]TWB26732.1 DNA invertase Pin-like site-specific DNA recombinase [Nitrospirillum amazonense]